MFNQVATYQSKIIGPGATNVGGGRTAERVEGGASGLLWAPSWNVLGGTYDVVLVQPFLAQGTGSPIDASFASMHNTLTMPAELSWQLGNSGFYIKTGIGIEVPDGTITGAAGIGNMGNPWWTFQPEFVASYLKDGWNLTVNVLGEINTRNTLTGYTSGDVLHTEFTATKTIGKWTFGIPDSTALLWDAKP